MNYGFRGILSDIIDILLPLKHLHQNLLICVGQQMANSIPREIWSAAGVSNSNQFKAVLTGKYCFNISAKKAKFVS